MVLCMYQGKFLSVLLKCNLHAVQFNCPVVSGSLQPHGLQHAFRHHHACMHAPGLPVHHQLLEITQTHLHWVSDAIQPISSSVVSFFSRVQSFPASGSFQMSQLFAWGGQSIGVSASTSVPPMNTRDRSPWGWTGWISLQSEGLSRVFSNIIVQKHQFFSTHLSS